MAGTALFWSQAAFAETNEAPVQPAEGEEIVVTGVCASLNSALNQKRLSTDFTDALIAEDFARFPEADLAAYPLAGLWQAQVERDLVCEQGVWGAVPAHRGLP